jgi:hypothetical protein
MSELSLDEPSIAAAGADPGHEAHGVQTFGVGSRRKRNVARRILLKSQQRLLWLWPQYFPKHDVTGRLKTDPVDRFERELELAEADRGGQLGSRAHDNSGQGVERSEPDAGGGARAREDLREQKDQPGGYWSDPGWRNAARQYHAARGHRTLVTEIQPERLAQLRRLLRNDISLDRVWHELNERGDQPAPQVTLDAVLYQLEAPFTLTCWQVPFSASIQRKRSTLRAAFNTCSCILRDSIKTRLPSGAGNPDIVA